MDGLKHYQMEKLASFGAKCIIQPGGSLKDEDVIKAAADLISEESPNYQFVAGRLICYNGIINVSISASDGQASGSGSFVLNVAAVNDAPVMSIIDNQTIDEDQSLTLELSAYDIDSSELSFNASSENLEVTTDGSTLSVAPPQN